MSIDIYAAQSLPRTELGKVADFVSDFTNGPAGLEARLLPLSPAEVSERIGFVACTGSEFRGYAGVSPLLPGDTGIELGPFVVPPAYRRQGVGARLLAAASAAVLQEGYIPYVFGNAANMGNLTRRGFRRAEENELTTLPYDLCVTKCPFFDPGSACCNTPVVLRAQPQGLEVAVAAWPEARVLMLP